MKLRIKGSSIRLRLTKAEVTRIREGLAVTETLSFGDGMELRYELTPTDEVSALDARLENATVRVRMPRAQALEWAGSEQVSLLSTAPEKPVILIEKDFFCLKPRSDETREFENESDLFANPNEGHGCCS